MSVLNDAHKHVNHFHQGF